MTESTEIPIKLSPALPADYPGIVDLANLAYRGTGPEASWNAEDMIAGQRLNESLLRADLAASPSANMLVFRAPGGDVGAPLLGCVWLEPKGDGTVWYLGLLAVRPTVQNQQLGRRLLAAAEAYARHHGAHSIRMSVVHVRETLIAWYQRRGYALTGETEPFPYGDERFGRPLRDDLHFVILTKKL